MVLLISIPWFTTPLQRTEKMVDEIFSEQPKSKPPAHEETKLPPLTHEKSKAIEESEAMKWEDYPELESELATSFKTAPKIELKKVKIDKVSSTVLVDYLGYEWEGMYGYAWEGIYNLEHMFRTIFSFDSQIQKVILNVYVPTKDKHGQIHQEIRDKVSMKRDLFEKINWENISTYSFVELLKEEGSCTEYKTEY